jgi:two-component system chemotaxis response regulator CheB
VNADPIRVLVVDDSAVVRGLLTRALSADASIVVAGTAHNGKVALDWLQKNPAEVVVLDVEMPVLDGLETLQQLRVQFPRIAVVMASSLTVRGAEITLRAMALGAAGCIAKPQSSSMQDSIQQVVRELVPLVKALGHKPTATTGSSRPVRREAAAVVPVPPRVVVIGTSTGGPNALMAVLGAIPPDFPLPILIVQHMPPTFTPILARHLEQASRRKCREGVEGEVVQPGTTYVAPGGFHMEVARHESDLSIRITQGPPECFCRPSVNPLFRSVAVTCGRAVLAVILTGMGEDGLEGSRKLVDAGGHLIAQDEASSVVWGMPGAVVHAGLAHQILPLPQIAPAIVRYCLQGASHR